MYSVSSFSLDFSDKPRIQHKPVKPCNVLAHTCYCLTDTQAMAPHIAAKALTIMLPPGAIVHSQQRQLSGVVGSYSPMTHRARVWLKKAAATS